jgi:hypothetical protein
MVLLDSKSLYKCFLESNRHSRERTGVKVFKRGISIVRMQDEFWFDEDLVLSSTGNEVKSASFLKDWE